MKKDLIDHLYDLDGNIEIYNFLDTNGVLTEQLTVGILILEIESFAKTLHKFPVGSRALLVFPTSKGFVVSFFACIHAGIIPVPVSLPSKRNGIDNIESIYRDSGASCMIFDKDSYTLFASEFGLSYLGGKQILFNEKSNINSNNVAVERRYLESKIAFLQYTSGSTSTPKGVIVTHKNVLANIHMAHRRFGTDKSSILLAWTPLYHDMGLIGNMLHTVYIGCKCYLIAPVTLLMRPRIWLSVLSKYKITVTGGPNFSYKHILERVQDKSLLNMGLDLSCLKVLYNGAEPIEARILDEFNSRFKSYGLRSSALLPCYGLAEATLLATGISFDEEYKYKTIFLDEDNSRAIVNKESKPMVSCGKAALGVKIRIRCQLTDQILSPNRVGIIDLKGDSISSGYWDKPERNSPWLDTGDLGFLDENSELYICGRVKDTIISNGRNIYPQDIEFSAESVSSDLLASGFGVFGIDDEIYLVAELSKGSLRKASKASVGRFKKDVTRKVSRNHGVSLKEIKLVSMGSIPRTTSFKIQRQKLKSLYLSKNINEVT